MKLLQLSDIHINHSRKTPVKWRKFLLKNVKPLKFDAFAIVGDIASNSQKDLKTFFGILRDLFPNEKVFFVLGNHDFWDYNSWVKGKYSQTLRDYFPPTREYTYQKMLEYHKELCLKYNLVHLDGTFEELSKDIVLMGFDGWYAYEPNTNDSSCMPFDLRDHSFMRRKAHDDLNKILDIKDKYYNDENVIKVCLTHFPSYTRNPQYRHMIANENYLPFICDEFDFLLIGHSHKDEEWSFRGCQIINCGSDYDKPQAKLIDLLTKEINTIKN